MNLRPLKETSRALLKREMDNPVFSEIRKAVESPSSKGEMRVADLHVWRASKSSFSLCADRSYARPEIDPLARQA
jgi:hypothetical protein